MTAPGAMGRNSWRATLAPTVWLGGLAVYWTHMPDNYDVGWVALVFAAFASGWLSRPDGKVRS